MEKILITYSGSGKDVATKVQETIKKAGFKSTVGASLPDDDNALPEVVIAIITNDACNDTDMADLLQQCEQKNINVVPFVTEALPRNILSDFFLDEHVWIDGALQPQNTALADLADLLKRNFKELTKPATKKKADFGKRPAAASPTPSSKNSAKTDNAQLSGKGKLYQNLFYVSIAVILVMLFILINGGVKQENREASIQQANYQNALGKSDIKIELSQDLKKSETALVGHWRMSDYFDNQFRATHADSVNLQQLVDALINRAQLQFNADKTFSRMGFAEQTETGTWEYDPQSKYLKLKPTGVNQYDVVQIQEVNATQLILVVTETVEKKQVITKMIFTKIN